jgi:hypothetical protein
MHYRVLGTFMTALTVLVVSSSASAQSPTGTCLPDDSTAFRLVSFFKAILTPTTPSDTVIRRKLGLTNVSPSAVNVITSEPTCTSAAVAVDSHVDTKRTNYPLYIISVGSMYGVSFAPEPGHGPGFAFVFDGNWDLIGMINTF